MAGLSCGMKCTKYLLFVFNFIIWVCGIAIMGVGIYSRVKIGNWDSLVDDSTIPNAANIMIAAGFFVMIIGFLGCCGAWKENKCLLILYAIALVIIFVLEIAAGIFAYTKKDTVIDKLKTGLNKTVSISYGQAGSSNEGLTKAMNWFQENVKCCGSHGPGDWEKSEWIKTQTNFTVPESCCDKDAAKCDRKKPVSGIYTKGCVDAGEDYVKDHMWEIGGVALGIAFVQFFGIFFAILLCRAIGYEKV